MKLPIETDGAWDRGWDAYYLFVDDDGDPTLAELRILPRTRSRTAERELHRKLKRDAGSQRIPLSPLTAMALRSVCPTDAEHYLSVHAGMSDPTADSPARFAEPAPGGHRRFRRKHGAGRVYAAGMRPDPDVHYAAFAQLYVDLVRRGSRSPIADIAAANPRWTRAYVRDQIYLAREKGFLTPERYGRADGDLTLKARRVLHGGAKPAVPKRRG